MSCVVVQCLEAIFDTYAVFGENIPDDLLAGGGPVTGGRCDTPSTSHESPLIN